MGKCPHYNRFCKLVAPCCNKEYMCRLCHDEEENHTLDRYKVKEIRCLECDHKQFVQRSCEKCHIVFGAYFCRICRMFDNIDRGQFHCNACGLCRVGGASNYFHCPKCDMCYGIALKDKHKCLDKVAHSDCPVCLEDLHSSTRAVHVPKCAHLIHKECFDSCLKNGRYACTMCGESLVDMSEEWRRRDEEIALTPMPRMYRNNVFALCKDCHETTETPFHVIGLKCQNCGSYNTCDADDPGARNVQQAQQETN